MDTKMKLIRGNLVPRNYDPKLNREFSETLFLNIRTLTIACHSGWDENNLTISYWSPVATRDDVLDFINTLKEIFKMKEAIGLNFSGRFTITVETDEAVPSTTLVVVREGKISYQKIGHVLAGEISEISV